MGSSPASHAHVAPTNLKQDGLCASHVVGASPPNMRGPPPSKTVTPKVSGLLTPLGDCPTQTTSQKTLQIHKVDLSLLPSIFPKPGKVQLPDQPHYPAHRTHPATSLGIGEQIAVPVTTLLWQASGTFPSILQMNFCTGLALCSVPERKGLPTTLSSLFYTGLKFWLD